MIDDYEVGHKHGLLELCVTQEAKSMASLGLCLCDRFVGTFPQRKEQRADAFALLHVEHVVVGVEGVEGDRPGVGVREIDPVCALRLSVD